MPNVPMRCILQIFFTAAIIDCAPWEYFMDGQNNRSHSNIQEVTWNCRDLSRKCHYQFKICFKINRPIEHEKQAKTTLSLHCFVILKFFFSISQNILSKCLFLFRNHYGRPLFTECLWMWDDVC